ncbi:MAG: 1-acyl-sn-glycerol-3-phosphate acyltransferase [Blastocatellia bacterium]
MKSEAAFIACTEAALVDYSAGRSYYEGRIRPAMRKLRATIKLVLFFVLSVGFYLLWLIVNLFLLAFSRAARWWRGLIFHAWARTMIRLLGMRLTVRGMPPRAPFFLVSNHLSYVDIIVYAALLDCVFVAKSDIAHWPFFGLCARSFNTIFIDRSNRQDIPRVNALIERARQTGWGVVLFPEGTSTKGAEVIPFRPSLLEPAAAAAWPVSYASISYRTPPDETPAHMAICWWGEMTFAPHLFELLQLRRFEAIVTFGAVTMQLDDRKLLAARLQEAVQRIFIPVTAREDECSPATHTAMHQSGRS